MHTHIGECVLVDRVFSLLCTTTSYERISIIRETSELKFNLAVTPWPLRGTSERRCFLFNYTTMSALSEGLTLLLFKKKFKVEWNLLNM